MALKNFFSYVYFKIVKIDDTPQKIALGLSLGVFLGFIPTTGPIAAVTLAVLLKLNRLSALIGSLITNTWLSLATLLPAIKIGSFILSLNRDKLHKDWLRFLTAFSWPDIFNLTVYKIILPVFLGYVIIGLFAAFLTYLIAITILSGRKYADKSRGNLP